MAEYENKVRKILSENGCYFVRHGKGDHDIWYSPITNRNVSVDGKIGKRHTANGIMKQAGIDYHFQPWLKKEDTALEEGKSYVGY